MTRVPDWLTGDFIKTCLQLDNEVSQDLVIVNYTTEPAVPAGNNYGSIIFRIRINYKNNNDEPNENSVSLIVKTPLAGDSTKEFSDFIKDMYEREPRFYNEFIKETYKLCKHDIVPKHYPSPNPLCVVLEDLSASGYAMVDRQKLLDFEHCQLYVKASAKLHALSVAVNKENPQLIQSLVKETPEFVKKSQQFFQRLLLCGLQCMAVYLEDKPDYKTCLDFFEEIRQNDILSTLYEEIENSQKPLKALVQMDPWCTNMMFKKSISGEVVGVKLIDFQGLKFTSPVIQLVTFVWSSAKPEVLKTKLNELYYLYCDSLNESFTELGCVERLSYDELKAKIVFLSPIILMVICLMIPICVADEVVNMNDYFTQDFSNAPVKESSLYKLYQGETFNKYYPQILDQLSTEGVFAYLGRKMEQLKSGLQQ